MADGVFAEWQPRYAEAGIPTFPIHADKQPAIVGYMKTGPGMSAKLLSKFGAAPGLGFVCKKARLAVLDVDTPDENIFADALALYGDSPIKIRSGGGNFQAWYRHNGEGRKIRPDKSKPIDILGGGMVVAPPTQGGAGTYQFLSGSLDDIASLPVLRLPDAANDVVESEAREPVSAEVGKRNGTLFDECMRAARGCHSLEALLSRAVEINKGFPEPLPADEVATVAQNAWRYEIDGKNRFGIEQTLNLPRSDVMTLIARPDAYALLSLLRLHNWDRRTFIVANEMAATMPPDGWSRKRFAAARSDLLGLGFLEQLRAPSSAKGAAIYRFRQAP